VVNVDAIVGVTKVGSWNTSLCAFVKWHLYWPNCVHWSQT
jgi:hypothetical protein